MKRLNAITFILFFAFYSGAQVLNQIGTSIKTSTETNATDYNRSRSNKEHNLNNASPKTTEEENTQENVEPANNENSNSLDSTAQFIFNSKIVFKADTYSENEVVESKNLKYTYNDSVFMFDSNQGLIINDYRANKMIIVDQEAKYAVSTTLISPEILKLTYATGIMGLNYVKTGKTKTIGGFSCSEQKLTDPNGKQISLWLSKENPFKNQSELAKMNFDVFFLNMGVISPEPNSVTLRFEQLNENGQIEMSISFESFSTEETLINFSGYQFSSY